MGSDRGSDRRGEDFGNKNRGGNYNDDKRRDQK